MGEITRMVRRYVAGEITYDQLERFYLNFPLKPRWANQPGWPATVSEQHGYMERNDPDVEDTEMELSQCLWRAGLSVDDCKSLKMAKSVYVTRRAEEAERKRARGDG